MLGIVDARLINTFVHLVQTQGLAILSISAFARHLEDSRTFLSCVRYLIAKQLPLQN